MMHHKPQERGAAAIMVAIAMLVLMGFAALALDGGLGFDDRRGTQNAADNAALAAAWESCNPKNSPADPAGEALAVAAENGYDDLAADSTVTVTELGTNQYEVLIETTNDTTFAPAGVGADSVDVLSRAVATCDQEPFLGGYAIFAGAESCPSGGAFELDLAGATKVVNGGIFSNGDIKVQGANTTINGPIEYRGTFSGDPALGAEKYFGSPKDYPVDLDIADWRPGGSRATDPNYHAAPPGKKIDNKWMVDEGYATGNASAIVITQPGIYYTDANIHLKSVTATAGVTFVAEGQIDVNGNASTITGYAPISVGGTAPLLFFSNYRVPPSCQDAIHFNGSDMIWNGLMFAPNGQVQTNGASNFSVNGSIIGYSVKVAGSNFNISWQDDPNADPRFIVELEE